MVLSRFVSKVSVSLLVLAAGTSFFFGSAAAQVLPVNTAAIVLRPSTNNPVPGHTVTITAESYTFDMNSATMVWYVDKKEVQRGIGLNKLDVTAPVLGKRLTISVTAVTASGIKYTQTMPIGSGSIDLIIETDGYTPPFFKGKIPLVFQNTATVIAVPHLADSSGKEYDPATLVYQWKKDDGTVLQDQSGYGKQAISLTGNIVPRPYYLIVTASNRDGSAQAQALIQISGTSPSVEFYKNDPTYGPLFNKAITSSLKIESQKETSVFASLFGFNIVKDISQNLQVQWLINGILHNELSSSKSVVLRAPDGGSGNSFVELDVKGTDNILQSATNNFGVTFDASSQSKTTETITL
jgi:hypothetical protein